MIRVNGNVNIDPRLGDAGLGAESFSAERFGSDERSIKYAAEILEVFGSITYPSRVFTIHTPTATQAFGRSKVEWIRTIDWHLIISVFHIAMPP